MKLYWTKHIHRWLPNSKEKRWAACITFVIALIAITPLCGMFFHCGCDWPWAGLDSHCNFYRLNALDKCPWCVSIVSGIFSTGLAIGAAVYLAIINNYRTSFASPVNQVVIRVLVGLLGFVIIAMLTAGIAAYIQGYPLGIGR